MVTVPAADHIHVNGCAEMDRQRSPELFEDFGLHRPDAPAQRDVVREIRSLAEVDHNARKRLVKWCVSRGEACDAGPITKRLRECLAEDDAGILDKVMRVDVNVTGPTKREVESAVARDLLDHMVEERKASRDLDAPASVQRDLRAKPARQSPDLDQRLCVLDVLHTFPSP